MRLTPLIFVVGPSGVGKSDVCCWIQTEYNFRHIDIDQHHGFNANGIRREWHRFATQLDPVPLASALRDKALGVEAVGVVVSFPSDRVLARRHVEAGESVGIYTIVLWGTKDACKASQARRDGSLKPTYDIKNAAAFETYSASEFADVRIEVFDCDGNHRPRKCVRRDIRMRLRAVGVFKDGA